MTGKEKRITTVDIRKRKGNSPIVCLTAYTTPFASILDKHVDILLVGDSLGMVLYGMESTLAVTVEMMCQHGKAVARGSNRSCIVVDMPFSSYQKSKEQAFENAARIMAETGCSAIKLEGGKTMKETIRFLTERGIPVMAHVGLTPQSVNVLGGYSTRGKIKVEYDKILADAQAVESAGAFSVVIEGVTEKLAIEVTKNLNIPTIGIGASEKCDGQVLVTEDMAGMFGKNVPKFVKLYGNMAEQLEKSTIQFAKEVRQRKFPSN